MTDNKNVFESEDSIVAMVLDAGEKLTAAKVIQLYNTFYASVEEAKKDDFYKDKLINDWNIAVKKSPARYRANEDIMLDLAELWLHSDVITRDDISRLAIGISHDTPDFYKMMDCYHSEIYKTDHTEIDEDSLFSSPERIKSALDVSMSDERSKGFCPELDAVKTVYSYMVLGINKARADKGLQEKLLQLNIDVNKPICQVFEDIVRSYDEFYYEPQHFEIQRAFWFGCCSLMFVNVMDRINKYVYKDCFRVLSNVS